MGAFCGTITPNRTFLSTGKQMLIVMETDASQQMSGFKINYETVKTNQRFKKGYL